MPVAEKPSLSTVSESASEEVLRAAAKTPPNSPDLQAKAPPPSCADQQSHKPPVEKTPWRRGNREANLLAENKHEMEKGESQAKKGYEWKGKKPPVDFDDILELLSEDCTHTPGPESGRGRRDRVKGWLK
jgi:hypothetical protein